MLYAKRYLLQHELGQGGMGTVHEAIDWLTEQKVALKRIHVPAEQLAFNSRSADDDARLALAREFQILASLHHPHVIEVLDYGFADGQPYYTMTLLHQPQTILAYAKQQPFAQKIRLVGEVLQALMYLHRQGILHRDLTPQNILVVDEQVQVVDFGLSVREGTPTGVAGTIPYIAPEILSGEAPTPATDLYAVGVIMYELFEGRYPYRRDNVRILIEDILYSQPSFSYATGQDRASNTLIPIMQRLLTKNPAERYPTAEAVFEALQYHFGDYLEVETEAIRASFLQAAKFVGREAEFDMLDHALNTMVAGTGSAWLVGGESGVGKSRLINEVATHAIVKGVLVLTGQAISEGDSAYHLWREPVRRLVLNNDHIAATDLPVLGEIVPDLARLLQRDVPPAVTIRLDTAKQRLFATLKTLLVQQAQIQPILLILEDIQWTEESLDVLKEVYPLAAQHRLMIIAAYRNDERPDLATELDGMQHLMLKRLSERQIEHLSAAILGKAGREPRIVKLLVQETEGNIFFIVEVLRALAEEVGNLNDISDMTIPASIAAGGIQRIIERRLERVPPYAYPLLRVAAVAGRLVDSALLHTIDKTHALDKWLTACARASVLELVQGQWRFAHDKLREAVIKTIPAAELPTLHRQIATHMEAMYADVPHQASTLAYHWGQADDPAKELHYSIRGGKFANKMAAPDDALRLFRRALDLLPADDEITKVMIYSELIQAYRGVIQYEQAVQAAEYTLAYYRAHNQDLEIVQTLNQLGVLMSSLGKREASDAYFKQALAQSDQIGAQRSYAEALRGLGWSHFVQGEFQAAHANLTESLAILQQVMSPSVAEDRIQLANILNDLAGAYWGIQDFANSKQAIEESIAIQREFNGRVPVANALGNLARLCIAMRDYPAAIQAAQEAVELVRPANMPTLVAVNLNALGEVYFHLAEYDKAIAAHEEVIANLERSGVAGQYHRIDSLIQLGFIALHQAQEAVAINYFRRAETAININHSAAKMLEVVVGYAWLYQRRGQADYARLLLAFCETHAAVSPIVRHYIEQVEAQTVARSAARQAADESMPDLTFEAIFAQVASDFAENLE